MRRLAALFVMLSLVLAACGGAATTTDATEVPVPADPGSTAADLEGPLTTESDDEVTPDATDAPPPIATDFDGPVAADFTIDLNTTGTFTLSEETRPVYLVFWAEW